MNDVVIVGGALSGTALAIHLLAQPGLRTITIVERGERIGRGPAFGTRDPAHRLNVPAGRMSLFPTRPLDFVEWMAKSGTRAEPTELVRRTYFGDYVEQRLREAASKSESTLRIERGEVVSAGPDGVRLADGRTVAASAVVLATGNQPPVTPSSISPELRASDRVLADPWRDGVLSIVGPDEDVLLVGTGLTAIDAMLTLAERGHRGRVTAFSRRGLLPRPHLRPSDPRNQPFSVTLDEIPVRARDLARWIRRQAREREANGVGWQCVLDALRPHVPAIWQRFSADDRALFVRRLRPYWDVLRHRAAPEALEAIAKMERVTVRGGRLGRVALEGDALDVELDGESQRFFRIVLCTGPEADVRRWRDPLYQQLLRDGHITSDPLGLGLVTDEAGRAVNATGSSSWLYTLGSLRRARLWETIAVPEIVPQAVALAAALTAG